MFSRSSVASWRRYCSLVPDLSAGATDDRRLEVGGCRTIRHAATAAIEAARTRAIQAAATAARISAGDGETGKVDAAVGRVAADAVRAVRACVCESLFARPNDTLHEQWIERVWNCALIRQPPMRPSSPAIADGDSNGKRLCVEDSFIVASHLPGVYARVVRRADDCTAASRCPVSADRRRRC